MCGKAATIDREQQQEIVDCGAAFEHEATVHVGFRGSKFRIEEKLALNFGIGPFIATLMGTLTGVGGGVIRDLLLARVPLVLVADIYASAAFVGGVALVTARRLGVPPVAAALLGGAVCFVLRMLAATHGWQLPKAAV